MLLAAASVGAAPVRPTAKDLQAYADHGEDLSSITDALPVGDRVAAIKAEIHVGKAACRRTDDGAVAFGEYAPPGDRDTPRSPCFRRWRLAVLLASLPVDFEIQVGDGELRAIRSFDDALIGDIARRLGPRDQIELAHLLALQHRQIPYSLPTDPDLAAFAVRAYHLEDAANSVSAARDPDVVESIALDPSYGELTRTFAIMALDDAGTVDHGRLAAIMRPLLADPSPMVAAASAGVTGTRTDRPATTDRAVFERALAVYAYSGSSAEQTGAASFAPRGLDVTDDNGRSRHIAAGHIIRVNHAEGYSFHDELAVELKKRATFEIPTLDTDEAGCLSSPGSRPHPREQLRERCDLAY